MSRPRVYRPKAGDVVASRVAKADRNPDSHTAGWPHLGRGGNCLCDNRCCFGPGGCKCPDCSHRSHP